MPFFTILTILAIFGRFWPFLANLQRVYLGKNYFASSAAVNFDDLTILTILNDFPEIRQ